MPRFEVLPFGASGWGLAFVTSDDCAHNPLTLLHIAARLRTVGLSPLEIFRRAGVPPTALLSASGWVPRTLCLMLGNQAAVMSGERFFGAYVGDRFHLSDLGAWGNAVLATERLEQACALASAGVDLLHKGSDLRFVRFRKHAELRFSYRGKVGETPYQHLLGTVAVLRKVALLANEPDAVKVRLSMPYSRGCDELEGTHGAALEFGCDHDVIVIDRDILDARHAGAGGARSAQRPAAVADATAALVRDLLPYGHPRVEQVAAHLRISVRTLQRRLRDWGFSFEELVDDIRRSEAVRLISERRYSAMEIAFLLGYSDQAHFTRAFKRWMGLPPRDYLGAVNGGTL